MDEKKEKIISDKRKKLMEIIEKDEHAPTDFRPNWLCGKCMNSYKSRNYALKYHKCKRKSRQKDPPYLQYMLKCKVKSSNVNSRRGESACCQRSVGRELATLIDCGTIEKETLNNRQKECINSYHSSLL